MRHHIKNIKNIVSGKIAMMFFLLQIKMSVYKFLYIRSITWCIDFPLGNRNFIIIKMTRAAQKNILQSFIIFILIESFRFTS